MNRKLFWVGYLLAIVAIVWIIWRQRKEEIERRLESMRQGGPFPRDLMSREGVRKEPAKPERREAAPTPQKATEEKPAPDAADDLQAIGGIGPAFARRLKDAGITRYAQIAALSADEIRERINLDPWRGDVESWIEQAQALAGEA